MNYNLSHISSLVLRIIPAGLLFIAILFIDAIQDQPLQSFLLNLLIYVPVILPFLKFGFPVRVISISDSKFQFYFFAKVFRLQIIVLCISLSIFYGLSDNNSYWFIFLCISIASINAMVFNYGSLLIRRGVIKGFLFQNGVFNLVIFIQSAILVFTVQEFSAGFLLGFLIFFSFMALFLNLDGAYIRVHNSTNLNFKSWLVDVTSTFYAPLLLLLAMSFYESPNAGIFFVMKVGFFISGVIGSLIVLSIKKLDKNSHQNYHSGFKLIKK